MIHLFLTFSDNAENSPFQEALDETGIDYKIFSKRVVMRYRHRAWLFFVGWPRLALFAIQSSVKSLSGMPGAPDAVVIGSHLEAWIFALVRFFLRKRTRVILTGFILTQRNTRLSNKLRRSYFSALFKVIDGVICHSRLEKKRYRALFPNSSDKFHFVPYGLHVYGYEDEAHFLIPAESRAFSAGRSGRDYVTLTKAFAQAGYPLTIVCDSERSLQGTVQAPNIEVLRDCYDLAYVRKLRESGLIVIPLSETDISAGQMVIVQSMAFRKPIIATATPTIEDYLSNGVDCLLVPPNDPHAIVEAVDRLREDPEFAEQLGRNAYNAFLERHSMKAFVANLVATISSIVK